MLRQALFVIALLASPLTQALEPEQLFKRVAPSVWLVRTADTQGVPLGSGSAVVIRQNQLITNCHVLGKAARVTLIKEKQTFRATLEQVDLERDLCLLRVTEEHFDAPSVTLGDSDAVNVGQRVISLGNPRALEMTLADGLVSRLQKDEQNNLDAIQTSTPVSPGSSGGGLFDMEGRLIGITQRIHIQPGSQNLNFAIPSNWINDLPARSKVQLDAYWQRNTPAAKK